MLEHSSKRGLLSWDSQPTASAIWLIGATGVAFGAGYYVVGVLTTAQCLLVFFVDYLFEKRGFGGHARLVTISFDQRLSEEKLTELLARFRPKTEGFEISQTPLAFTYVFRVRINVQDLDELGNVVRHLEGVLKFQVE